MAMDASRWTVLDVRALASIRAVGYSDVPESAQRGSTWLPYLDACRGLAQRTGSALRTVDRALFAANGRSELPRETARPAAYTPCSAAACVRLMAVDLADRRRRAGAMPCGFDLEPGVEEPTRHQPGGQLDPSDTPPARRRPGVLDRDAARLAARRSRGVWPC